MKRRIVQQGPTTLMVSLPIKWVRKYGLSKGDEIELEEYANTLRIVTEKKVQGIKTEITIDSDDKLYIWRVLQPLYTLGCDEIKIYFTTTKTLDIIQELAISFLIGFEMIHQEKNYCVLKSISTEREEQFSNILKRVFQNILQMSEIIQQYMQRKTNLSAIINLELMNNRHTMFLKRLLIKEGYEDLKKIPLVYSLVVLLEKIANEYKYLTWYLRSKNTITISKSMISYYTKIHEQMEKVYTIFYSYDTEKVKKVILEDIRREQIHSLFKQDPDITHHLMQIIDLTRSMLFQIMGIKS